MHREQCARNRTIDPARSKINTPKGLFALGLSPACLRKRRLAVPTEAIGESHRRQPQGTTREIQGAELRQRAEGLGQRGSAPKIGGKNLTMLQVLQRAVRRIAWAKRLQQGQSDRRLQVCQPSARGPEGPCQT